MLMFYFSNIVKTPKTINRTKTKEKKTKKNKTWTKVSVLLLRAESERVTGSRNKGLTAGVRGWRIADWVARSVGSSWDGGMGAVREWGVDKVAIAHGTQLHAPPRFPFTPFPVTIQPAPPWDH